MPVEQATPAPTEAPTVPEMVPEVAPEVMAAAVLALAPIAMKRGGAGATCRHARLAMAAARKEVKYILMDVEAGEKEKLKANEECWLEC